MHTYTRKDGTTLNLNQLMSLNLAELGVRNSILASTPESPHGVRPVTTPTSKSLRLSARFRGMSFRAFPIRK